jgi:diguanylate cyclase (GGDEF)-like protein
VNGSDIGPGAIHAAREWRAVAGQQLLPWRRVSYGVIGAILSTGAPIGLAVVRLLQHGGSWSVRALTTEVAADPLGYAYVGVSTTIAFALFGFLVGGQADRLAVLSETDALTGLHNARGLSGRFEEELARFGRYRQPLALLLVDLDGLKRINDRSGHLAGDVALRRVADAIRAELRATDIGARWGGDEFAILAPNTGEPAALILAERIRTLIARRNVPWRLTASIGVAVAEATTQAQERMTPARLMRIADAALYEAKRRGRNTVSAWHSGDDRTRQKAR